MQDQWRIGLGWKIWEFLWNRYHPRHK